MAIKKMEDLQVKNKTVLVRVDYNVPVQADQITDDSRIQASLPTLRYLLDQGCGVTLMSHFGRPKGVDQENSLARVARHLAEILGRDVPLVGLDAGPAALGSVQLLENLRFEPGETKNDRALAERLAHFGSVYINDAFGAAHRAHASIEAVTHFFAEKGAGFLMQREVHYLREALREPERPYVAILGGSKVSDKLGLIRNLMPKVDALLIGGAMSYTFLKALGVPVGKSRVEADLVDEARAIIQECQAHGPQLVLPKDHMVAQTFDENAKATITLNESIDEASMGLDIGPETIQTFTAVIKSAKTVVWNGPMGVFEWDTFSTGTITVAEAVASCAGLTVIGGGDSVAAAAMAGVSEQIDHISTGGGAALELLSGLELPGIRALED
ncbi:MAG: phosphoglycerate kinase [Acidobacteria bacterium]|nr:phosphoglycerate kinase [Acidobacteriota bacterium]MCB9398481.1 phosphoglycerate kinase [Acidobacteriota bacterium]